MTDNAKMARTRQVPCDKQAEQWFVNLMFTNQEDALRLGYMLAPIDFYHSDARETYEALVRLAEKGRAFTGDAILAEVGRDWKLPEWLGARVASDELALAANIKDASDRRRLISASANAMNMLYGGESVSDAVRLLVREAFNVLTRD